MAFRKVTMAAFLLLACAASARTLLKEARPSQCDAKSGKWDRNDINCDFTCPSGGWELDCKAKNATSVPCKVDKDKAPDSADIKFTCTVPTPGQSPDCTQGLAALSSANDTCVSDTVKAVLAAWKATP